MISRGDLYRLVGSVSNLSGRYCSPKSSRPINLFIFMTPVCFSRFFVRPITKVFKRTPGLVFFYSHHKTDVAFLFFFFFENERHLSLHCDDMNSFVVICVMFRLKTNICVVPFVFFFLLHCVCLCVCYSSHLILTINDMHNYICFLTLHGVLPGLLPCVGRKFVDVLAS